VSHATATQKPSLMEGPGYLLIRRLQSLTGIVFGLYLVVHLIVNASIAQYFGGDEHARYAYQTQVNKIHSLPFLEGIEWTAIFIPFLVHAIYGTWITVTGRPNVSNYPYKKNQFYLMQRVTAVAVLLFALFHVLSLKFGMFGPHLSFDPEKSLATIRDHMQVAWWVAYIVYPLGILSATFHTANGFWIGAITWGLTISSASQRRWGYLCVGIFLVLTAAAFVSLFAATNLPNPLWEPSVASGALMAH